MKNKWEGKLETLWREHRERESEDRRKRECAWDRAIKVVKENEVSVNNIIILIVTKHSLNLHDIHVNNRAYQKILDTPDLSFMQILQWI